MFEPQIPSLTVSLNAEVFEQCGGENGGPLHHPKIITTTVPPPPKKRRKVSGGPVGKRPSNGPSEVNAPAQPSSPENSLHEPPILPSPSTENTLIQTVLPSLQPSPNTILQPPKMPNLLPIRPKPELSSPSTNSSLGLVPTNGMNGSPMGAPSQGPDHQAMLANLFNTYNQMQAQAQAACLPQMMPQLYNAFMKKEDGPRLPTLLPNGPGKDEGPEEKSTRAGLILGHKLKIGYP